MGNGNGTMRGIIASPWSKRISEWLAVLAIVGGVGVWAADARYVQKAQMDRYQLEDVERRYIDKRDELTIIISNKASQSQTVHVERLLLQQVNNKLMDVQEKLKRMD